ncbi:MAG: hypothetical protein WC774_04285 [Candidatus Gracilibacteria bacterium]
MEILISKIENTSNEGNVVVRKTRRELQDEIRKQKSLAKSERKAAFRRKTEKKLAEKSERKILHKVNNTKRKLEKKIQERNTKGEM